MPEQSPGRPQPWTSDEPPEGARAAATLIVLRDAPEGGPPQALMLERSKAMSFAAGAVVFPGGRVDPGDVQLAGHMAHGLSLHDAAARIAAIRETMEEAGIAVGLSPSPSRETVAQMRSALHDGAAFGDLLRQYGVAIELDTLTPFARWCPGRAEQATTTRIFDTRFYVARAPVDAHLATADATENILLRWASAAETLADCEAGRQVAIFPTLRNLERLALGGSYAAVIAEARAFPAEMVIPWAEERGGERYLCIPDHLGYPVTAQLYSKTRRT